MKNRLKTNNLYIYIYIKIEEKTYKNLKIYIIYHFSIYMREKRS